MRRRVALEILGNCGKPICCQKQMMYRTICRMVVGECVTPTRGMARTLVVNYRRPASAIRLQFHHHDQRIQLNVSHTDADDLILQVKLIKKSFTIENGKQKKNDRQTTRIIKLINMAKLATQKLLKRIKSKKLFGTKRHC